MGSKRIMMVKNVDGNERVCFYNGKTLEGTIHMDNGVFIFSHPINVDDGLTTNGSGEVINGKTLVDGADTDTLIGPSATTVSVHIKYVIKRGSAYQEGVLRILNDNSNPAILDDFQDNGVSPGIEFFVYIQASNLYLRATATLTGVDALFNGTIQIF